MADDNAISIDDKRSATTLRDLIDNLNQVYGAQGLDKRDREMLDAALDNEARRRKGTW